MSTFTSLKINLDHVLQSIETTDDVARFALEAIDQLSLRFIRANDYETAQKIGNARTEFTKVIVEVFKAPAQRPQQTIGDMEARGEIPATARRGGK
jgi:hypothetical protein